MYSLLFSRVMQTASDHPSFLKAMCCGGKEQNMQINGKKELALALVLYACLRSTVTQNKNKSENACCKFL